MIGLGAEQLGGDDTELRELRGLRLDVDDPNDIGLGVGAIDVATLPQSSENVC